MSYINGQATFCRFRAIGDAPAMADEAILSILQADAFKETALGMPDETEAGWTTGDHIYDTQFSYQKNGYGPLLMFALRIDTNKVPSDIKHAYKRMNEQTMLQTRENPTGFLSRREKREANDLASRQIKEQLASGQFRRSKAIMVLWDLARQEVFFESTANAAIEQLTTQFHDSFAVNLEPITSGTLAGHLLTQKGMHRDFEDLLPSAFSAPPADTGMRDDEENAPPRDRKIPSVPWTSSAIDIKDFIGNEFLIWLWHLSEKHEGLLKIPSLNGQGQDEIAITVDKALDFECAWGVRGKQTLRSDGPTRQAEAGEALYYGKWPRKAGLILADVQDGRQWEFSLQADRFHVSAAKLPDIEDAQTPREQLELRLGTLIDLAQILDGLFNHFIQYRVSQQWPTRREAIAKWIHTRHTHLTPQTATT